MHCPAAGAGWVDPVTDNTNQQQGAGGRPQDVLRRDRGIHRQLVLGAVVVGLILIAAGIALFWKDDLPIALPALVICVGFGLVLSAFGSRAGGTIAGFAVVGSAALAVVLFVVLQYYLPDEELAYQKRASISGDFSHVVFIRILDSDPLYMITEPDGRILRFIILDRKLKSPVIRIQVDTNERGNEYFEMTCDAEKVARKYLSDDSGAIDWTFYYSTQSIYDGTDVICSVPAIYASPAPEPITTGMLEGFSWVGAAAAQEPQSLNVEQLIQDLTSDDAFTRRNARYQIGLVGPEIIPQLMEAYAADFGTYRIRLGVLAGITEMLRNPDVDSSAVADRLTSEQLWWIVRAVYDPDKTVRSYATEALVRLANPQAIEPLLAAIEKSEDPNGTYNSILVLKSLYPDLPEDGQKQLISQLEAVVPKENLRTWSVIEGFAEAR
jgi:hypothetical protein